MKQAKISEAIDLLVPLLGADRDEIWRRARKLREAGLLPTGSGRAGAPMTLDHWANLLIGIMLPFETQLDLPKMVAIYGGAKPVGFHDRDSVKLEHQIKQHRFFEFPSARAALSGMIDLIAVAENPSRDLLAYYNQIVLWRSPVDRGMAFIANASAVKDEFVGMNFQFATKDAAAIKRRPTLMSQISSFNEMRILIAVADFLAGRPVLGMEAEEA